MRASQQATRRAGVRVPVSPWFSLAMLLLPSTMTSIDSTVLQLAVPRMSAALQPSGSELLWILDSYGLVTICLLIPMGALADRVGRRRVLLAGVALFGAASLLGALATSPEMLIAARGLMGVAAGTLLPPTLSLISVLFPDESERATAISLWLGGSMLGMIAGPLVGGLLLDSFWWGSVFVLGVPVMAVVLVFGPFVLPDYRVDANSPLDSGSVVLAVVGMLLFVYGAQSFGGDSLRVVAAVVLVAGLAALVAFVRRQRRIPEPVLDVGLFADPRVRTVAAGMCLAAVVISGSNFFVSQQLQAVFGLAPVRAGSVLAPAAAASIVGYLLSARLQRRFGPRAVIVSGFAIGAVGLAAFTTVAFAPSVAAVLVAGVVMSFGLGGAIAACATVLVTSVPTDRSGSTAVVQEVSSQLGVVLGFAVVGTVGTALYRELVLRGSPAGSSEQALDQARSTVGAAVSLPPQWADLIDVARDAFSTSFAMCAGVSAAALVALAWWCRRSLPAPSSPGTGTSA